MVCKDDWEPRHPQELIKPMPTERPLPWTRPEPSDQFISVTYDPSTFVCSLTDQYGVADIGAADCAIVGNVPPSL